MIAHDAPRPLNNYIMIAYLESWYYYTINLMHKMKKIWRYCICLQILNLGFCLNHYKKILPKIAGGQTGAYGGDVK